MIKMIEASSLFRQRGIFEGGSFALAERTSKFYTVQCKNVFEHTKNVFRHTHGAVTFNFAEYQTNMIKNYALISFFICFLPTGACHSYQLIGTATLSEELVAQHYTINPNLDAVIVVDRTTPTFEYQTYYGAGSVDEAEGQQGRIHFLEHIMSGTGSHASGKLSQIIANNNGEKNAFTTNHFMYLKLKFPREKLDLAVEIDRDRFYNTLINEEVVEHEKKIILIERSRRVASIPRRFDNYFFGLICGKKNFDGLGTEAFIKQLKPDDLKAYYENFLRRQKRLVVVIGDVDIEHVLTKLDEAYGNEQISNRMSIKTYSSQIPNREVLGRRLKRTSKGLSITRFRKGWYTPDLSHRDYATLLILTRLLGTPSNSLWSNVLDSKLASVFKVGLSSHKEFGLMHCYAELPHDTSRNRLHAVIRKELEKLKSISEEDLNAARNRLLRTLYSEFYNHSRIAFLFGQAFAHANDPLLYPKLFKNIKSIHKEDIPRIIDQYLTDDNSITLSLTLPTQEIPTSRTPLHYGIVILTLAGFLTLLVWGGKKLHRKFSRKANEYVSESDT